MYTINVCTYMYLCTVIECSFVHYSYPMIITWIPLEQDTDCVSATQLQYIKFQDVIKCFVQIVKQNQNLNKRKNMIKLISANLYNNAKRVMLRKTTFGSVIINNNENNQNL